MTSDTPGGCPSASTAKTSDAITLSNGTGMLCVSDDGLHMFVLDTVGTSYDAAVCIRQFDFSTPFDASTVAADSSATFATTLKINSNYLSGIEVSPDGKFILISIMSGGNYKNYVYKFKLATAYDVTSAEMEGGFFLDYSTSGIAVSPDGTTLYAAKAGSSSTSIYEFSLST